MKIVPSSLNEKKYVDQGFPIGPVLLFGRGRFLSFSLATPSLNDPGRQNKKRGRNPIVRSRIYVKVSAKKNNTIF
jgi:hypothetical protein